MPKPMLRPSQTQEKTESLLSATVRQENRQNGQLRLEEKMRVDRLLRGKRSKAYIDALRHLDAGGHTHNREQVDRILNALAEEFPEVSIEKIMIGIVSKCYLGAPYEVHTLDIVGAIIEHYTAGHALPGELEKARSLAIHAGYAFIEVYYDCCRCIGEDGSVAVIMN